MPVRVAYRDSVAWSQGPPPRSEAGSGYVPVAHLVDALEVSGDGDLRVAFQLLGRTRPCSIPPDWPVTFFGDEARFLAANWT
jgi:hypothetical protein